MNCYHNCNIVDISGYTTNDLSNNIIYRYGGTHRYSDVVIHNNVAYLSGIVPTDLSNNIFGQTQEVLQILDKQLNRISSSKENILSMTIYLKDASLYEDMNIVYDRWVNVNASPARATIGIVSFPNPRWLIELVVTAAVIPQPQPVLCNCSVRNPVSNTNYSSSMDGIFHNNVNFII